MKLKLWPHLTVIAVLVALLAGIGTGLLVRHHEQSNDEAMLTAARIQHVDGDVALNNSISNSEQANEWIPATANQPFAAGDRIYTRNNAHASIAFNGRNFARINPNTSLDLLTLNDRRTQLALRDGSAMFDVGYLDPGQLFEVATPYGAVDFDQPGLYSIGIDNGNAMVSVLNGLAQVVGLGGSGRISRGEVFTLAGQTAADVVLSRVNGRDAGYAINDYYRSQYPNYYDGRYSDYNAYLNDPYYFDPYRRNVSYQHASAYLPGLNDLDYYGDWQNINGYGYCWHPRVDSSWAPYEDGYWLTDYPYGPTWVSNEPWGYAPYHYGRWANLNNQWYWVPDNSSAPRYSPALVAFIPVGQNEIGWVPLGPGDAYAPRYYSSDWQPHYLSRVDNRSRFVNLDVANAVTIAPIDQFSRLDDFRRFRRADRRSLQNVQAVLDPLTVTPLRNAVIHSAWGRGKIDVPPGIAKKLNDTRVITSADPIAPPFRRDLAQTMRVERVGERLKQQQLKVRDERGGREQGQPTVQPPSVGRVEEPRTTSVPENRPGRERQMERGPDRVQSERASQPARESAQGERAARPEPAQQRRQVEVTRQQTPRAMERAGRIFERKPVERTPQPIQRPPVAAQPQINVGRGRASRIDRAEPRAARPNAPPTIAAPPQQKHQDRQPQPRDNGTPRQKNGPPAGNPHGPGGGKGKKP